MVDLSLVGFGGILTGLGVWRAGVDSSWASTIVLVSVLGDGTATGGASAGFGGSGWGVTSLFFLGHSPLRWLS